MADDGVNEEAAVRVAIRALFDIPNPGNQGLMKKAEMAELCEALGWDVATISKACKANAYGVVDYDDWEKLMMNRFTTNFKGNSEGFIKRLTAQAKKVRTKMITSKGSAGSEPDGVANCTDTAMSTVGEPQGTEAAPGGAEHEALAPASVTAKIPDFLFRCQKCRMVLFSSDNVDDSGDYAEVSEMKRIAGAGPPVLN